VPRAEQRPADALAGGLAGWRLPVPRRRRDTRRPFWESAEKFQAFGEKLMPLIQQAGLKPDEPIVFPAHNFVNQ
jgi:hypothetical protein